MATNSLQSLHHQQSIFKRHHSDSAVTTTTNPPSSLFLKPSTASVTSLSSTSTSNTTFTLSAAISATASTAAATSSAEPISFDLLQHHLSTQNFRQADEETRRLLIVLAGEAAQKRGYVFFSEVKFIAEADLKAIDDLWRKYSDNKFGYSVQKRIWEKSKRDFTNFFIKVGWMKKLDTEVEQYNYRAFPNEFIWENNEETPEGHLPLTNALRGTQLLNNIFNHPVFENSDEEEEAKTMASDDNGGLRRDGLNSKPLSKGLFKPDYSF